MKFPGAELPALLAAVSFASGLNVYATVATLGLLAHTHVMTLPGQLQVLSSWWIIGASGAMFAVEFFADKIPVFDLVWNALHTFIRVPVSALMAYQAAASLSPGEKLAATLAGGAIAFIAHGGKTAVRAAVTPSPEPVSNIGLSLGGDALSISLTWLATVHPYIAGGIAVALIIITILLIRWVWRAMKNLFRRARTVQI
jgi:hypothetical protein